MQRTPRVCTVVFGESAIGLRHRFNGNALPVVSLNERIEGIVVLAMVSAYLDEVHVHLIQMPLNDCLSSVSESEKKALRSTSYGGTKANPGSTEIAGSRVH